MNKKAAMEIVDDTEVEVVAMMATAHTLAEQLFGNQMNVLAVEQIYDYLSGGSDEKILAIDLQRVTEHVKVIYKTIAPTPEQVFGLFMRIFPEDDEE